MPIFAAPAAKHLEEKNELSCKKLNKALQKEVSQTLTPRTNERLCYNLHWAEDADYPSWQGDERFAVNSVAGAVLVGSKTTKGTHAPAFDVDHKCALVKTSYGVDLWVDAPMTPSGYRQLMQSLQQLGLSPKESMRRSSLKSFWRKKSYNATRPSCTDDTSRQSTLKALGPELNVSFEEAVFVASEVSNLEEKASGPEMRNPWRIPFYCEVMLVPSTHNFHVYLDTEMPFEKYMHLLKALSFNIVEPGYYKASKRRGASYLRLPWIEKGPDGKLYPKVDPAGIFV